MPKEIKVPEDFELAMKRLETVVSKLESGNISLEESLSLFREGIALSKHCSKKLDEAEGMIEKLLDDTTAGEY